MVKIINDMNLDSGVCESACELEPSILLKGAPVANAITESLSQRAELLRQKGVSPCLAVLMVGENSENLSYKAGLAKRCAKSGIELREINLPVGAGSKEVLGKIAGVNADPLVHGLLVLRPFADKTCEQAAASLIDPKKDVDCMSQASMAKVFVGSGEGFAPCTAEAVMEILSFYGIELEGRNVALVGRSNVVGKPLAMLLMQKNATVTICHTKTVGLSAICARADIVVAAAGRAKMLGPDFFSEGQFVIDVGVNMDENEKLCGDVDLARVDGIPAAISPVPGGVGAVTTSVLAKHVIIAAENSLK